MTGLLPALVFGLAAGLVLAPDRLSEGFGEFLVGPAGLAALCAIDPGSATGPPFPPSRIGPDEAAPPDLPAEPLAP